ncbi:MAG: helix-turn-helix domain-containing protein [Solirubrobacterales bacterium]
MNERTRRLLDLAADRVAFRVLMQLRGGALTESEIGEREDLSHRTVYSRLVKLSELGLIASRESVAGLACRPARRWEFVGLQEFDELLEVAAAIEQRLSATGA